MMLAAGAAHGEGKRNGAILPGGDAKQPVNIEAGKLDYFDKEQKLIYTGSVVATQGTAKLKASVLTIFLASKTSAKAADAKATDWKAADGKANDAAGKGSSNQVQRMTAEGPVTMVQKDQIGTGDNAAYDKAADTVVLTGNVVLTQGENVTKGDKLVYDLKTGHATVSGKRVSGMFKTGSDTPGPSAPARDGAAGKEDDLTPRRAGVRSSSR